MADITVHLMPEVSNPSQLKPSFLLLNAFSQINALIHMLTAAQLPLHGLSCETFIKVWDGEQCLTMKLFNLRNALGPNCTSPFLVLGQGGEWEIKNSLSCGSGQIKTHMTVISTLQKTLNFQLAWIPWGPAFVFADLGIALIK
ncbi:hypothetical protein AAG906_033335 [Vitis piasezkii]